jgi:hypothetical protein
MVGGKVLVLVNDGQEVGAFGEEDDDRGNQGGDEEELDEVHRFGGTESTLPDCSAFVKHLSANTL